MSTKNIVPQEDEIVSEIDISAPPERVFQALTDARELKQWFTSAECPVKFWDMDPRADGAYRYATEKGSIVVNGVSEFECHGHITEFDPPRVLAYTWYANWHDDSTRRTLVRWELTREERWHARKGHAQRLGQPAHRPQGLRRRMARGRREIEVVCRKITILIPLEENTMATATITPDKNAVVAEIFIAAPPARVFQSISDPAQPAKWWGQSGLYHVTNSTMDVRPGSKWRSDGMGADGQAFYVEGEYLEVDPPGCWCTPGREAIAGR